MSNASIRTTSVLAVGGLAATLAIGLPAGSATAATHKLHPAQAERGLMAPGLAADAHGGQVLTGVSIDGGRVVAFERHGHGSWHGRRVLSRSREDVLAPSVAMSSNGWVVAAWADGIGGPLHLRVRRPGGAWQSEHAFRKIHVYGSPQVAVNRHGAAVVAADAMSGDTHLAVRRNGEWRVTDAPLYGAPVVGMDGSGAVVAVATDVQRGSQGEAFAARYGTGGHWSHLRELPMPGTVQDVQVAVAPSGAITIAGGYVSRKWRSTSDGASYWPTAYRVIRTPKWGAGWQRVWQHQGVPNLSLASAGSTVQVTWEQWADPHKRLPTRRRLFTRTIAPHAGAAVRLTGSKTSERTASYAFDAAVTRSGRVSLVWRNQIGSQRDADAVHAVAVSPGGAATSSVAVSSRVRDWADTVPRALPDGTVAWVAGPSEHHTRDFGWVLDAGRIATARVTVRR